MGKHGINDVHVAVDELHILAAAVFLPRNEEKGKREASWTYCMLHNQDIVVSAHEFNDAVFVYVGAHTSTVV